MLEIRSNCLARVWTAFDKHCGRSAATQGLDPQSSAPREQVQSGLIDEDIAESPENSLADLVRCWPGLRPLRCPQMMPLDLTRDNTHALIMEESLSSRCAVYSEIREIHRRTSLQQQPEAWQTKPGDMPPDEFREYGARLVEWIANYMETGEAYPVLSRLEPGDIGRGLPVEPPETPEALDSILRDFGEIIIPGITHWNQPGFLAYFGITGSAPGMLAEMLAAALNVNAMLWRTSPAATELEDRALDWLRQLLGLPNSFEGVIYDTASTGTLVAVAAARESLGLQIREKGMAGRTDLPRLSIYCSEQAHSSVDKAAIALGIGLESVRKISVDAAYRMDAAELQRVVEQDIAAGWRPFCVAATVGTTSTTSVDPLPAIADLCERFGLWLHVDAVYGGVAAILPEMRWVLEGAERADSIVFNPHKWLFTQIDCSAFYSSRLDTVRAAFSLVPPAYLQTVEGDAVRDYMNYGPQLGRRFRALKLWFVLRAYGRQGLQSRLREHIRLAQEFAARVDEDPDWERMAPVPFSTVCFRARPRSAREGELDDLNLEIEESVNAAGEIFISHTIVDGKVTLRVAIGHIRTEDRHLRRAWQILNDALLATTCANPDAVARSHL
jgi:aromatic-L-amino-acid/L-tryptophan decarboxylase